MTKTTPIKDSVGAREAGRQLGVSHSYLLRLAKADRLPRSAEGLFDVEECRRILAATTDVGQVRTIDPDRWSQGHRPVGHPVTSDQSATSFKNADLKIISADQKPDPAEYRNRADLPDDFARGVLYGAHAVAYQVPHAVAETLWALGFDYDVQRRAYLLEKDAVFFLAQAPLVAIGLEGEDDEEPTALSPTLFLGLGPMGGTGL